MSKPTDTQSIIVQGTVYGLIAALVNLFLLVPVYGQLSFHLGQTFVLVCLLTQGMRTAGVAALISSLVLAYSIDNTFFIVLMLAELIVVWQLTRIRIGLLSADLLYWLIIGIPISYIVIDGTTDFPTDYTILVLAKQLLNGMLYTLLARIIFMFIPESLCRPDSHRWHPTLAARIFYLSTVSIVLPSLIISLMFTSRATVTFERQINSDLNNSSSLLLTLTETFIDEHLSAVQNLSEAITLTENKYESLALTQKRYEGFITMLISDADGRIVYAAPETFNDNVQSMHENERFVDDRGYFLLPKQTGQWHVSNVFQGRGFGNDPIIAISSPIFENGEFAGVVEGSLNLSLFNMFEESIELSAGEHHVIVLDNNKRVIYRSENFKMKLLSVLELEQRNNVYSDDLLLTRLDNEEYLYTAATNRFGWQVYVLSRPSLMTNIFLENIVILMLTIGIIGAIFALVTKRFSNQITAPLVQLTEQFSGDKQEIDLASDPHITQEVEDIAYQLQQAHNMTLTFNQQLEQQVKEQTSALSDANKQLEKLAREDAMTGLFNRRYFDQEARRMFNTNMRNNMPLSLALLDIDHFKQINDSYGHPFGDECIIAMAKCITEYFNRTSDIVARYGGEEFILLMAGGNTSGHLKQLDYFRDAVSQMMLKHEDKPVFFTISIGAITVEKDFNTDFEAAISRADEMLYQSKENGRNKLTSTFS